MTRIASRSVLLGFIVGALSASAARADVVGIWLTQGGDAKIAVSRCGRGICGRIVWLKDPIDRVTGKPQIDDKNPNPLLSRRTIVGLSILSNMEPRGPSSWTGSIYNADNGKIYATTITLQDERTLEVKGCAGPLCGSEIWSRATK